MPPQQVLQAQLQQAATEMNAANTHRSDNNYKGKYSHRAGGTDDQNTTMTDDLSDYSSSA